jgi:hypothetical protein
MEAQDKGVAAAAAADVVAAAASDMVLQRMTGQVADWGCCCVLLELTGGMKDR